MKHLLLCILIVNCVLLNSANSQWNKQSPIPTDRDLYSVTFSSPTHVFATVENHYLLESTNAGVNWIIRLSDNYGTDPYYAIHFSDAAHGYIIGNNDDNLRTTDGGVTWIPMTMFPGSWSELDFITPTQG